MSLSTYKQKRDFKKTAEPKGKVVANKKSKLIFIIQKHAASHLHYDFRLELNGVLLSWAVPKGPSLDPSVKRLAMHVEDHPLQYAAFEGIIPQGQYGGGTVMLWDKGEWISEDENPLVAYQKGSMKFRLRAKKLNGRWKLVRMHQDDKTWLLIKAQDEYAKRISAYDITRTEPNSVISKQSIEEIAENYQHTWGKQSQKKVIKKAQPKQLLQANLDKKSFPRQMLPQLATLVAEPPIGKQWIHEIKFDGYRILAFKKNNKTRLMTRNGNDWTTKFKPIAKAINNLPIENVILDGEIVILDKNNKSDFQALQNVIKDNQDSNLIYYAFDLPYYDHYNLTQIPLLERKKLLQNLLVTADNTLRFSKHQTGNGEAIFKKACRSHEEGIISKESNSVYVQERSKSWLKIKCIKRQEFVIGGYTKPEGARNGFGALLLGTYNNQGDLIYHGNVGTGFTAASLKSLHKKLKKYQTDNNPFATFKINSKNITWVKPVLVAEVEFTEWTSAGSLRHPSFKGLRRDKKPKQITVENEA